MMRPLLILALLANLSCAAEADYEWLAKELQVYLPEGVTAVVAYKGEKYEHVRIRWEKPFVRHQQIINASIDDPIPTSLVHDPIDLRIAPYSTLKDVYAHKAQYFTMKSNLVEWTEKLKEFPGIRGKDWAFGDPEEWLRVAKPTTDAEKKLVAAYEAFITSEYKPVMAQHRTCPNFIFKGRFILLASDLDRWDLSFESTGYDAIKDVLRVIEARCSGTIEKY
jgi:hypothetical protein